MTFRKLEENTAPIGQSTDNFGHLIADGKTNEADIAAHYDFSPERWRLYKNGDREFFQYNTVSDFTDEVDGFRMAPSGGDSLTLKTAERFRYKVGYVVEPSVSFKVNQALQNNDIVTVAYGDADLANVGDNTTDLASANPDGWVLKITSSGTEFNIYRGGSKQAGKPVSFKKGLTTLSRIAMQLNWYNVGSAILEETYTDNGFQRNTDLVEVGVDDGKGPETANKRIQFGVRPDSSTSGLELETGSTGFKTLGDVSGIKRSKPVFKSGLSVSAVDTWEPLFAARIDPEKDLVNTQIASMKNLKFDSSETAEILAVAVDSSKTDATGFEYPDEVHEPNSAVQVTENVSQIPNESGSQVSPDAATEPGGFAVAHSVLTTDDGAQGSGFVSNVRRKRPLYDGDHVVFLARSSATGNVSFRFSTLQQW